LKQAYLARNNNLIENPRTVADFVIDNDCIEKSIQKIANGSTPGHDSISIEHFKLAHPSIPVILKVIFNIFLRVGIVPCDFGLGVVTPIPKFKGSKRNVTADDFRGITVSVIPSKIFEHCLVSSLSNLPSSSRQFGFKKGLSCADGIASVRKVVNFFNKRGNTLSIACVDVKKAFDKANFWEILGLLVKHGISGNVVDVLRNWFLVGSARVKWNGVLSDPVSLLAGVRQGGILSPLLFSAYVDEVLVALEASNVGCFIKRTCFNSFMYADDLILLSLSVVELQTLLTISADKLWSLDLAINTNKTVCLRIGVRWRAKCCPLRVYGSDLHWADEAKYLGVLIKGGVKFSCNWQSSRSSYYKATNSVLGVLGANPSCQVALELFRACCLPILTYGISPISLAISEISQLAFAYNNIFFKLFRVKDSENIALCQYYSGFWPFYALYEFSRYCFLLRHLAGGSIPIRSNVVDYDDYLDFFASQISTTLQPVTLRLV